MIQGVLIHYVLGTWMNLPVVFLGNAFKLRTTHLEAAQTFNRLSEGRLTHPPPALNNSWSHQ